NVYVSNITKSSVLVYDGATGAKLSTLVKPGDGGLDGPVSIAFLIDPELHTARVAPGIAGQVNSLAITNGTPGTLHFLIVGTLSGSLELGGCPNVFLGIGDPHLF